MADARGIELPPEPRTIATAADLQRAGQNVGGAGHHPPRDNGKDFTSAASDLWFADDGYRPERIAVTARIGIKKAVDEPLRFVIAGNPFVSGPTVR